MLCAQIACLILSLVQHGIEKLFGMGLCILFASDVVEGAQA